MQVEAQGQAPGAHVKTHGTRRSYLIGLRLRSDCDVGLVLGLLD